jgi:hypothetical protein
MSDPQFIRTPQGEELVVLAKADYEALVSAAEMADEDDSDVAIYDQRKADLAEGRDERLPYEISAFLVRGDTRLKAIRKWRRLPQGLLAARAQIGQGYLSELERGIKRGGPDTLQSLAGVLDVPADWLS